MRTDSWQSGSLYESYVGRWSRFVAAEFLPWLGIPPDRSWLDLGCGTGALTRTILDVASPATVKGIDPSESYISYAREGIRDPRAEFLVGRAEDLPLPDESIDAAVSAIALNFVPDPLLALAEMKRATVKDGTIGVYVWDYAGKMELMRYFWDAAIALDASAISLDEGRRFPLCNPGPLTTLFTGAGLHHVELRAIDIPTRFESFDEYWKPFLGGQGPAPGYAMSLRGEKRDKLRDRIRSLLPVAGDGSIDVIARAWAIKGIT